MTTDLRERILASGLREVELPSGLRFRGRLPTVDDVVRRGLLPADLSVAAQRLQANVADFLTATDLIERQENIGLIRALAAAFIEDAWDDGEWVPFPMTPDELNRLDETDIDELERIVLRLKTPAQVTADSRGDSIDREKEAAATVTGWTEFRDDASGDGPSSDGDGLAHPPERPAKDPRPRRRARARPGVSKSRPAGASK